MDEQRNVWRLFQLIFHRLKFAFNTEYILSLGMPPRKWGQKELH